MPHVRKTTYALAFLSANGLLGPFEGPVFWPQNGTRFAHSHLRGQKSQIFRNRPLKWPS